MIYLLISILASVSVSVLLKIARQKQIGLAQAIGVNYAVATLLTAALLEPNFTNWQQTLLPHAWLFGLLGVLLPSVFVIMGKAVQHAGIVKSDAAQRLSLFLPVLAAFALFGETLTPHRAVGLLLAFAALACLLIKPQKTAVSGSLKTQIACLLGVWLGYGVIDILFKKLYKTAGTGSNLLVMFALAGVLMAAYLVVQKARWTRASIIGGIVLGSLNFVNILFYLKAHRAFSGNPTLVFAGMNMGVIALGALVGAGVFKEKLSALNIAGVVLALTAVGCLFYGVGWF